MDFQERNVKMDDIIRTKGDLLKYIERMVIEYAPKCNDSIKRNNHMNKLGESGMLGISQDHIDAVLVDFVNYIGTNQGLDWGLYTKDLYGER